MAMLNPSDYVSNKVTFVPHKLVLPSKPRQMVRQNYNLSAAFFYLPQSQGRSSPIESETDSVERMRSADSTEFRLATQDLACIKKRIP